MILCEITVAQPIESKLCSRHQKIMDQVSLHTYMRVFLLIMIYFILLAFSFLTL